MTQKHEKKSHLHISSGLSSTQAFAVNYIFSELQYIHVLWYVFTGYVT